MTAERLKEPKMDSYPYVLLRAENADKNAYREYSIQIAKTLFGEWEVQACWGRVGAREQIKCYYFKSYEECLRKMESIVKKRLDAKKRIGCAYRVVESLNPVLHSSFIFCIILL